jgi:pyrroloquinoline quinone (PQQ) biosynthesis protein C
MISLADQAWPLVGAAAQLLQGGDPARLAARSDAPGVAQRLARAAFESEEPQALAAAHRVLFALYELHYLPGGAAHEDAQFDPAWTQVRLTLERAWVASLERQLEIASRTIPAGASPFAAWAGRVVETGGGLPQVALGRYLAEEATLDQVREIVVHRSIFFLREPDPWAMVVPTLRGAVKAAYLDLLLDEYGWGRHEAMHSTSYARLMTALDLVPDHRRHLDRVAWEYLAVWNLMNLLGVNRAHSRKMLGYVYSVEARSPANMGHYLAGLRRLGVDAPDVLEFFQIHQSADQEHRETALSRVIEPAVAEDPEARLEVARGLLYGLATSHRFTAMVFKRFCLGQSTLQPPGARP